MRKTGIILLAILLLGPVLTFLPVQATITGRPTLTVVTTFDLLTGDLTTVNFSSAADPVKTHVYKPRSGDLLAINMTGMTVSGAQVWLWISKTGGAVIEPGDLWYAGPISMNLIGNVTATYKRVEISGPNAKTYFWVGNNIIIGPITTEGVIPDGKTSYYVKITDVSPTTPNIPSSDVAVSVNRWQALETILLKPTYGPAGTSIAVTGIGFNASKLVNITFGDGVGPDTGHKVVLGKITPQSNGYFTGSFYATDLDPGTNPPTNITLYAAAYYHNESATMLDWAEFNECGRAWLQLKAKFDYPYLGNWSTSGQSLKVHQKVYISGNWFNPRGDVALYMDYNDGRILLGTTSVNGTGFFNTTITIPEVVMGGHSIWAVDYSNKLVINVTIIPTLELVPDHGPIGTVVTAYAYGFEPDIDVYLYWWQIKGYGCSWYEDDDEWFTWVHGDYYWFNVANGTTGSDGKFTTTVQFVVPHTYGGVHDVWALDEYFGGNESDSGRNPEYSALDDYYITGAEFDVTAVLSILPSSEIKNDGSKFYFYGTGFDVCTEYWTNVDNQAFQPGSHNVEANSTGDVYIALIAAGFTPGWHVLAFYPEESRGNGPSDNGNGPPEPTYDDPVYALFTVSSVGDPTIDALKSMNATVVSILTDPQGLFIVKLDTAVGTLTTKINELKAEVTSIKGDVATVKTAVGTLEGKIVAMDGNVATIKTDVGTIKADAAAAKTAATAANTAATSAKAGVDSMTTTLYIAVVLSLIAAVAAAICAIQLMRKLAG